MNKSKSCSNFSRRTLSESEKTLLNKYKNIDNDKKDNNELKINDYFEKGNNFDIKEIEKKLDNNYLDFTFTNNLTKKYFNENIPNNNTLKEIKHKTINIYEYIPSNDFNNNIDKSIDVENKTNFLEKTINQKLINKYINPEKKFDNIIKNKKI